MSGHKEARFLIKLESQDQQIDYRSTLVNIKGCGFFFPFPVPPDKIMCSMKIAAMLERLMHHCEAIVLNGDSYRMRNVENKVGYRNINQNNIENNN